MVGGHTAEQGNFYIQEQEDFEALHSKSTMAEA